jgi:hypothetical protein
VQLAGRPVETDLSLADWIVEACQGQLPGTVASLVPPVFESYARVFHPAVRYRGDEDVDVTWAEVAAANRTTAHALMEWGSITGSMEFFDEDNQSPLWDDAPAMGHLPEHVAERLATVLRRHTTTPEDCWFGLSDSWVPPAEPTDRGLTVSGRGFWLVRGPVELAAINLLPEPSSQSANIWWPADHAWFVATDIDLVTTYVGGDPALVGSLLAAPGLECAPATPGQSTAWNADTVNPLPFDGPEADDG